MEQWKKINSGVKDLWVGTGLFFLLASLVCMLVAEQKAAWLLGLLVGSIVTIYLVYHMYESLDVALDLNQEEASKYLRNKSITRWIFRIVIVLASVYIPYISTAGVVIAMFGLKFSAYFQPLIHKLVIRLEQHEEDQ